MNLKSYFILLIVAFFLSESCTPDDMNVEVKKYVIDTEKAKAVNLDPIAIKCEYVPLMFPDNIVIGAITYIKSYGNYLFLHDRDQTKPLPCLIIRENL